MFVKDLVDVLFYDASKAIVFNINNKNYSYFEVASSSVLHNIDIRSLKIEARLSMLDQDDIMKVVVSKKNIVDSDIELVIPNSSHYYYIHITIN
jgi:hypothetical protein